MRDKRDNIFDEETQNYLFNWKQLNRKEKDAILRSYGNDEQLLKADLSMLHSFKSKKLVSKTTIEREWKNIEMQIRDEKIKNISSHLLNWTLKIASILIIPLLLTTLYLYNENKSNESIIANGQLVMHTVYAPLGGKTEVTLPDGSHVFLNAGTKLTYPSIFSRKERIIDIDGEGFFSVKRNAKWPMVINTHNAAVRVYGTTFNLHAYSKDQSVVAELLNGKISFVAKGKNTDSRELKMKPGEECRYDLQTNEVAVSDIRNKRYVGGWRNNLFLFEGRTLGEVIKTVERCYNVEIITTDSTLLSKKLAGSADNVSLDRMLTILSYALPIEFRYEHQNNSSTRRFKKQRLILKSANY